MFNNSDETIKRELKLYIGDWYKLNIKNKIQLSCTTFFAKYGSLALYDYYTKIIFIIDHKQLQFDKNYGCILIGIPEKPDGALYDHECFWIYDDKMIEFNQLIKIEISCGSLYQMNQMKMDFRVNQQRYTMTIYQIRRGVLPNIKPSIFFR